MDWGVSLTHFYLAEDIAEEPLAISDGEVALPAGPGLGIDVGRGPSRTLQAIDQRTVGLTAPALPGLPNNSWVGQRE